MAAEIFAVDYLFDQVEGKIVVLATGLVADGGIVLRQRVHLAGGGLGDVQLHLKIGLPMGRGFGERPA